MFALKRTLRQAGSLLVANDAGVEEHRPQARGANMREACSAEYSAGRILRRVRLLGRRDRDATRVIVLVLSEHAAASQHVLREVERASSKRHPVIAFRIDLAPMPADLEYFLNTSQWLDASAAGVRHALPRLVDAVKIALTQPFDGAHAATLALPPPQRRARDGAAHSSQRLPLFWPPLHMSWPTSSGCRIIVQRRIRLPRPPP